MRTISLLTPLDDTGLHRRQPVALCPHSPACPAADSADREAAAVVAAHPEQGWSLLCNAVVLFEDTGELLPDGRVVDPHRPVATLA
jgi:uncharacterized protein DUF5999